MHRKIVLFTILLLLLSYVAEAQRWKRVRTEVFFGVGAINSFTDLGGANKEGAQFLPTDFELKTTRPVIQVGVRHKLHERWAVRLNLSQGWLKGDDALTQEPSRAPRGASFQTFIFETSTQIEYSLTPEKIGSRYTFARIRNLKHLKVNTYIFAGIGGFYFNPIVKGDLNPVTGQSYLSKGKSYSHLQMVLPVGIGFKYGLTRKWAFALELSNRYTFTDYLDNHSDIHSKANDSYMFMMFTFSYKMRTPRAGGFPKF